ncbi:MAG: TetR/AcrR family transcriptional regulator [Acidobacteriota bacterium]|nr:TetR/AcrR family transcriptional regulator [Acidobacteriota bacterium]MDY0232255.1 TetR/AcrR family transcriptional regulator [Candidatus Saccharicenans sp.]
MLEKYQLKNSNFNKNLSPHANLENQVNSPDETSGNPEPMPKATSKNKINSHKTQKTQAQNRKSGQSHNQIPNKTSNKSSLKHLPKQKDLREERQQKKAQINKMYIFRAAERVLIRKGYTAMTMDDIAQESQFSKATIYQYFKGKGELIYEVVASYLEDLNQQIIKIKSRDTNASTKLKEVIRCVSRFHKEKENIARVFMMDKSVIERMRIFLKRQRPSSNLDKKFLQMVKTGSGLISSHVADILAEGINSGEFNPVNLNEAVAFLASTLQGFCHQKYWFKKQYNLNQETELVSSFFLHGIARKDAQIDHNDTKADIKTDIKPDIENSTKKADNLVDNLELEIESIKSIESIKRNAKEK